MGPWNDPPCYFHHTIRHHVSRTKDVKTMKLLPPVYLYFFQPNFRNQMRKKKKFIQEKEGKNNIYKRVIFMMYQKGEKRKKSVYIYMRV